MKITISIHVGDLERRAINARVGQPGLASKAACAGLFYGLVSADLQVIVEEYNEAELAKAAAADRKKLDER